ncbi:type II secretion system protein [Sulfurospirillum arsenophilum]|uniref:type II secretion system protein n=1 Tax=Sulfurospirillum arsenophilum TaxID=56698 RepID=UPI000693F664|nr:prepilin-type N-terminal cleavage/methylation domain-containing protein [Sulfurospirillum arsenophilum]
MKKGFTMIELIFVIVILGILASVAIPKLAATRDDAKAAALKTDIGTVLNAVPAWYQGQKELTIVGAMSFDTSIWQKTASKVEYTYKENSSDSDHITIKIVDANSSATAATSASVTSADPIASTFVWTFAPWLVVDINSSTNNGIVKVLTNMGVTNTQIGLRGSSVKW